MPINRVWDSKTRISGCSGRNTGRKKPSPPMKPARKATSPGCIPWSRSRGRNCPIPYPTTEAGLKRGHKIYQSFCIGCHGPIGDGMGPAQPFLYPPPLNFTILKGRGSNGRNPVLSDHERHHREPPCRILKGNWSRKKSGMWGIMLRFTLSVEPTPAGLPKASLPPMNRPAKEK